MRTSASEPERTTTRSDERSDERRSQVAGRKSLVLLSGRAYPELADEIAAHIGSPSPRQPRATSPTARLFIQPNESVRGIDAFVIQSYTTPINQWVMETLILVDALKRASAKRITVVAPFYPYARQDKKHRGREPISARLIADLFKTAGADRLMAVDLHTAQIQGFFDGPVDHLFALPLLAEHVLHKYGDRGPRRRLPRHRPGAHGRAVGRRARRPRHRVRAQDPRHRRGQRGRRQPGGRRGRRPHAAC